MNAPRLRRIDCCDHPSMGSIAATDRWLIAARPSATDAIQALIQLSVKVTSISQAQD